MRRVQGRTCRARRRVAPLIARTPDSRFKLKVIVKTQCNPIAEAVTCHSKGWSGLGTAPTFIARRTRIVPSTSRVVVTLPLGGVCSKPSRSPNPNSMQLLLQTGETRHILCRCTAHRPSSQLFPARDRECAEGERSVYSLQCTCSSTYTSTSVLRLHVRQQPCVRRACV